MYKIWRIFKRFNQGISSSINLLFLKSDLLCISADQYIKTIPLATYDPPVGQTVTATGWGKRFDQDRGSDILQVVELPIMNRNECNQCFDGYIKAGMICVSGIDRKGACNVRKLSNYFSTQKS